MEQIEGPLINDIFTKADSIYQAQYVSKKIREATYTEFLTKVPTNFELLTYMRKVISIGLFSMVKRSENNYEHFSGIYNAVFYDGYNDNIAYNMPEYIFCDDDSFYFEQDSNSNNAECCIDDRMKECDISTVFKILIKRGAELSQARQITFRIFSDTIKKYNSYPLLCYLWMNYRILNLPIKMPNPKDISLNIIIEKMINNITRVINYFYV
jgi:hypothetical protein